MPQIDHASKVESLLEAMTIEEKIGQLTMVRVDADSVAHVPDRQLTDIRQGRGGSVFDLKDRTAIKT